MTLVTMLLQRMLEVLTQCGCAIDEVIQDTYDEAAFGNTIAVVRTGPVLIQASSDRGDEFVEVGVAGPDGELQYFSSNDVEVALGAHSPGGALSTVVDTRRGQTYVDIADMTYPLKRIAALLPQMADASGKNVRPEVYQLLRQANATRLAESEMALAKYIAKDE